MTRTVRWAFLLAVLVAPVWSHAQSCTPISGFATVVVTDLFSGNNYDVQGSVTFSCTRPKGNTRFPSIFWVGASGANGSRTLSSGARTLAYQLYTDYSGCATPWSGTTGLEAANSLTGNTDTAASNLSVPFCMRIATSGQNTARPLTFTGSETLTIKSDDNLGFQWGMGTLSLTGTVNALCKFPTAGNIDLSMSYTSFQATAANTSVPFDVQCTNSTSFSLALDATSGTVPTLNLSYQLGLGAIGTQSILSQAGTGIAQSYSVLGRLPANQSGTCANPAGCSNSATNTLTVSY